MRTTKIGLIIMALFLPISAASHAASNQSRLIKKLEAGEKQVVVTYGTSLTDAGAWVKQIAGILRRKYPDLIVVHNSGGSGKWSEWGVENLDDKVLKFTPDTVFIEFSINDCVDRFGATVEDARKNLNNMIDRILKANPDCEIILMVMNPATGNWASYRSRLPEFNQMYRDVANERELRLIDHYPQWKRILDETPDLFAKYVPDGLHPGVEGCSNVTTPGILRALGVSEEQ